MKRSCNATPFAKASQRMDVFCSKPSPRSPFRLRTLRKSPGFTCRFCPHSRPRLGATRHLPAHSTPAAPHPPRQDPQNSPMSASMDRSGSPAVTHVRYTNSPNAIWSRFLIATVFFRALCWRARDSTSTTAARSQRRRHLGQRQLFQGPRCAALDCATHSMMTAVCGVASGSVVATRSVRRE